MEKKRKELEEIKKRRIQEKKEGFNKRGKIEKK